MEDISKSIVDQIKKETENVPFGNSQFQNIYLSANQETPERKYRHLLLQMDQKINTLMEVKFKRRRLDIEIQELEEKIRKCVGNGFEKQKLEIDLEEKNWHLNNNVKLINDAIIEVSTFYSVLKTLPKCTREEFEKNEKDYWSKRFLNEAQLSVLATGVIEPGLAAALKQIGYDPIITQEEIRVINQVNKQLFLDSKSLQKVGQNAQK